MKRMFFALALFLSVVFSGFGQNSPQDIILLLDTSASMSGSYREVSEYLSGPFLKEFLRVGDTFHLLPFSGTTRVDVSRLVEGRGDLETIIGRILLMYPVEPWSDVPSAVTYAEKYAASLPSSRLKKIILVTDGDVSPGPGGSASMDAAGLANFISDAKARLSRQNTGLEYVKVPLGVLPSSGRPAAVPRAQQQARQTPPASAETPRAPAARSPASPPSAQAGSPGAAPPPSSSAAPETDVPVAPEGTGSTAPVGEPPVPEPSAAAPSSPQAPPPVTVPDTPPPPVRQDTRTESSGGGFSLEGLPLIIGIALIALLVLGIILFLAGRNLHGSPNRAISRAAAGPAAQPQQAPAAKTADGADLLASYAANQRPRSGPYAHRYKPQPVEYDGPLMLNLFVEDQNTFIGKRNIHALKAGYTYTVGGGKSDFLIFLVPIPPHIGEVRCDGNNCTFIPRKSQYFPDIGSQQVSDCIGKTIRVVSDKKYELHFRMERYEDPLRALNRLLLSVRVPG